MDRRRKAAPLPIFNKRPRQALFAHPNNVHDSSELYAQEAYCGDYSRNTAVGSSAQSYGQEKFGREGQSASYYNQPHTAATSQARSNWYPVPLDKENVPPPYQTPTPRGPFRQQLVPNPMATCAPRGSGGATRGGACGPSNAYLSTTITLAEKSTQPSKSYNVIGTEPLNSQAKSSRLEFRVLTATAQGIQHWSKLHHVSCLLFEVFGILNSAVTSDGPHAKHFLLKTSDGIVKCVFWEMDRYLPPLVRGHALRVVGNWDTRKASLKCYSVRPTRPDEEQLIIPAVQASQIVMEQLAASAAEA